jgi:hypothetical protein
LYAFSRNNPLVFIDPNGLAMSMNAGLMGRFAQSNQGWVEISGGRNALSAESSGMGMTGGTETNIMHDVGLAMGVPYSELGEFVRIATGQEQFSGHSHENFVPGLPAQDFQPGLVMDEASRAAVMGPIEKALTVRAYGAVGAMAAPLAAVASSPNLDVHVLSDPDPNTAFGLGHEVWVHGGGVNIAYKEPGGPGRWQVHIGVSQVELDNAFAHSIHDTKQFISDAIAHEVGHAVGYANPGYFAAPQSYAIDVQNIWRPWLGLPPRPYETDR